MQIPREASKGFLYGCDPEFFIVSSSGTPVPASDFIPGTKESPEKTPRGAIHVDGLAAEINIDPVDNFKDFNESILVTMEEIKKLLPRGFSLSKDVTVTFPKDVWDRVDPMVKELGCEPDLNAWTGEVNLPPNVSESEDERMRCAGGHLHIGWCDNEDLTDIQHVLNCRDLVKQLDWFLGAWSIKKDSDKKRRSLYGKAGACRYKSYGVEYRVLSNFWTFRKDYRQAVWDRMQTAIYDMRTRFYPDRANMNANARLQRGINEGHLSPGFQASWEYPILRIGRR